MNIDKITDNFENKRTFQWLGTTFEDYLEFLDLVGIGIEYADASYNDDDNSITLKNTACGRDLLIIYPKDYLLFYKQLIIGTREIL